MVRLRELAVVILAVVACNGHVAKAAVMPLLSTQQDGAVAVALSGDDVVVGGDYRAPVLRRIPAMGGRAAIVLPRARSGTVLTGLGASASRVVVATQVLDRNEEPVEGIVYVGAAAGPTTPIFRWAAPSPRQAPAAAWLVDAAVLISTRTDDKGSFGALVFAADGAQFSLALPPAGVPVAAAGNHLVVLQDPLRRVPRLTVIAWPSGEPEATWLAAGPLSESYPSADIAADLAVRTDGAVAWIQQVAGGDAVVVASPGAQPRAVLHAPDAGRPRWAGGNHLVLAVQDRLARTHIEVLDVTTGAAHRIGPAIASLESLAAADGRVAWLADQCVVAARLSDGPSVALKAGPCGRIVLAPGDRARDESQIAWVHHDWTVRVAVVCVAAPPTGCDDTVTFRSFQDRLLALGRVRALAAGRRSLVSLRLTGRGRALLRSSSGHAVDGMLWTTTAPPAYAGLRLRR